jgi:NTP pyrophosphatase (non-canonical NTP hydrolase)
MARFNSKGSLSQFQNFNKEVYGLPDDRLFSLPDLLSNQERFAMRALKGIRKGEGDKLKSNLLVSFSWLAAIAGRLHIDMEEVTWRRFPSVCSYCGKQPCSCKKIKLKSRRRIIVKNSLKPKNLAGFQKMLSLIYPVNSRTLFEAGVHLAEEVGELNEVIHFFLGEHKAKYFEEIKKEIADVISCFFSVANSAKIDMAADLGKMYYNNCHVCHKAPCNCNFSSVAKFES